MHVRVKSEINKLKVLKRNGRNENNETQQTDCHGNAIQRRWSARCEKRLKIVVDYKLV